MNPRVHPLAGWSVGRHCFPKWQGSYTIKPTIKVTEKRHDQLLTFMTTQSKSAGVNPRQGRAHKLKSFIVFSHVLKASASNGSKNILFH